MINDYRTIVFSSLQKLFPVTLLYAWLQIIQLLFIQPNSFFNETLPIYHANFSWLGMLFEPLSLFLRVLSYIIIVFFIVSVINQFLNRKNLHSTYALVFIGIGCWVLYNYFDLTSSTSSITSPFSMFQYVLFAYLLYLVIKFSVRMTHDIKWIIASITIFLTVWLTNFLITSSTWNFFDFFNNIFSKWIGNGATNFLSVGMLSILGIFTMIFGLYVPNALSHPTFSLPVATDNYTAALNTSSTSIPHLLTLYTLQNPFALFGGIGLLLPLAVAIYIESKKGRNKQKEHLALLTIVPLLFDQNLPLLFGLPVLFQPILLIPMIISTLFAESLGALCLYFKFLSPAVYKTPTGTPNLLFGFLASDGNWRYFIIIFIILLVSVAVYRPFVKKGLEKETEAIYETHH